MRKELRNFDSNFKAKIALEQRTGQCTGKTFATTKYYRFDGLQQLQFVDLNFLPSMKHHR